MNKIVISIVALVLIGLGGFAFVQQKNKADTSNGSYNTTDTATSTVETTSETTPTETTPTPTPTAPKLTAEEVAKHTDKSSCYTIINESVYDLTAWIAKHPGGEKGILSICGKDGTAAFMGKHGGGQKQIDLLATFRIGALVK